MAKYFLKVTSSSNPKNLLQEAIRKEILAIDQSLHGNLQIAKDRFYEAFDRAVNSYKGRCKEERPSGGHHLNESEVYRIYACNMMVIAIYLVKKDFT